MCIKNPKYIVLLLLLLFAGNAIAQYRLALGEASVREDGTIVLPLLLGNPGEIAGLQFDLADDSSVLRIDSVSVLGRADSFAALTRNNRVLLFHPEGGLLPPGVDSLAWLCVSTDRLLNGADTLRFSEPVILADSNGEAVDSVQTTPGVLRLNPVTGIDVPGRAIPARFQLFQNYPNPYNNSTVIRFAVSEPAHVEIVLYNIRGEQVRTLVHRNYLPGSYRAELSGDLPSGVYIYRMQSGRYKSVRKCLLIK